MDHNLYSTPTREHDLKTSPDSVISMIVAFMLLDIHQPKIMILKLSASSSTLIACTTS